jgi:phage FluMu protein Com
MTKENIWKCPNCGSTNFVEIKPNKRRCEYCGSILTPFETTPALVKCPRCGFQNERDARYCNQCGMAINKWKSRESSKTDPALISIIATIGGSFFVPIGGAILGLILAYKALKAARASSGRSGSEGLARAAVAIGWIALAISALPLCLFPMMIGGEIGHSLCGGASALPYMLFGN